MITEWRDKELIEKVKNITDEVAREGAEKVMKDAKNILMKNAKHPTGELASRIKMKVSKFKDGGYIVQAQGPGDYNKFYATFVELGTKFGKRFGKKFPRVIEKLPYLRPALAKNKRWLTREFKERMK